MDPQDFIHALLAVAQDAANYPALQAEAAEKLAADCDGTVWPHDGCAIMLSVLLQHAGLGIPSTCMALDLARLLAARGWNRIEVGDQQAGDVGTTCGDAPDPGVDHIYLVVSVDGDDEMTVADNQAPTLHSRSASGVPDHKSPTTYFLRA